MCSRVSVVHESAINQLKMEKPAVTKFNRSILALKIRYDI